MIHGCYEKQSGDLRVTDGETDQPKGCSAKEAPLAWNQQGPQGPPGPQGPAGGPPAPHTQVVGRVTLEGVNGGNPFSIRGFSWGAENGSDGLGGGGSGKTTIDEATLVHDVGDVSPALIDDVASGAHLRTAQVELFAPGTQTPYTRYTLTDVVVTKVVHTEDEETFSLRPVEIQQESIAGAPTPQLPAGSQRGTLVLDGIAGEVAISGDAFEIDGATLRLRRRSSRSASTWRTVPLRLR